MVEPIILWFRDDLRLSDNPALHSACGSGRPVLPVFVLDEERDGARPHGAASRWWLHHALAALAGDLSARGAPLRLLRGPAGRLLPALAAQTKASSVVWNRRYDKAGIAVDTRLKADLGDRALTVQSFNAALLREPWEVKSRAGEPLRVFSPFWRAATALGEPAAPLPAPARIRGFEGEVTGSVALDALELLPQKPDWAGGLRAQWTPGEAGARARLTHFIAEGLPGYAEGRDRPDRDATSKLSPHLRFGEIGPRQIWHAVQAAHAAGTTRGSDRDVQKFLAELGWREFSYNLLYHHPDLGSVNLQRRFDAFPWTGSRDALDAWQNGRTGFPIVDAGMRQLWTTGWMHNRVRMIVASFLIKDLMIDWRAGEDWFWDTLVDADPANNAASWQWVAGSGADAAPFFRVFNPVLQGERFDPQGRYVARWVPELARLPPSVIQKPWTADDATLAAAGLRLGHDYPRPIVDHDRARQRALAAFASLTPTDA
jgi:deoxyribodipyrimidine photo-lyase